VDLDNEPLGYLQVLSSYPVAMSALAGLIGTGMFNFISPINVINYCKYNTRRNTLRLHTMQRRIM
jgi:hypothetical protein